MTNAPEPPTSTPPPLPTTPRPRRHAGKHATRTRNASTQSASRWVLAIAIMQLLFGLFFGWKHGKEAAQALRQLDSYATDEELTIDGTTHTAAALRQAVERESLQAYVVPIGLAVAFALLYLWARKSPLPALCTALALFVTIHAVEAIAAPTALARGVIVKVLFLAALASGIKSALQQRALDQRLAEPTT